MKILFAGATLTLTFWGAGAGSFFPSLSRAINNPVAEKKLVSAEFKNEIYIPNSAAFLAGEELNVVAKSTPISLGSESGVSTIESSKLSVPNAEKPPITLRARVYLVSDLQSEDNIADENQNKRWPIASLSKLMVAVIALENISKTQLISVGSSAVAAEGVSGRFSPGEIFTADDLLKALLTVSSNDAAMALSQYMGEEKFVSLMNAKVMSLGMLDTFFKEPTGLSVLNQSTAHDLKVLTRYVYEKHPDILRYSQAKTANIIDAFRGTKRTLININQFAGRTNFLGGKTGYTNDAGENLISLFSVGGKTVIIIVMDAQDRFAETLSALEQFERL